MEALGQRDMRMYYHTYDQQKKRYTVGLACSRDGFKWQKQGPIFEGSGTHAFDAKGASAHHIVKDPEARRWGSGVYIPTACPAFGIDFPDEDLLRGFKPTMTWLRKR